jgi:hypothetical protein
VIDAEMRTLMNWPATCRPRMSENMPFLPVDCSATTSPLGTFPNVMRAGSYQGGSNGGERERSSDPGPRYVMSAGRAFDGSRFLAGGAQVSRTTAG